ncbi:MAG: glutathione S-transferase, partial [Beijerinckiaceae bacterium]
MKLYDSQIAPNPRRVRIFLAEKGVVCPPRTDIDIRSGVL